jgi:hypothetical protein
VPGLVKAYDELALEARDNNTELYYRLIQCSAFLKKLELPRFRLAARDVALHKWLDSEASCKEKNGEIWEIISHPLTHSHDELDLLLQKVRKEIAGLLGDFPPDLDEVVGFMKFGPGATLTHTQEEGAGVFKILNASAYEGMEDEISFLARSTLFRDFIAEADPALSCIFTRYDAEELQVSWFSCANYGTVPKSISEERTIEIGPSLATFVQQGYDGWIRKRLHSQWGLDLRFQNPNKVLAWEGSISGDKPNTPCTIDLSSASDRISYGVVYAVLPPDWVRTLTRYRAREVLMPNGTARKLEKFSSMGNALTFSLQTLIFSAVVRSVFRDRGWEGSRWRVYGDDIIVPHRIYEETVQRLELLGFRVNQAKSFSTGYFRESCGGDYLHGTYVRPFYLKKPLRTVMDVCRCLNDLALHTQLVPIPASDFRDLYQKILSLIPKSLRVYGDTDCDPGSCIWTPQLFRSKDSYIERRESQLLPDKLGMASRLLTGYLPPWTGQRRYIGGFIPPGVELAVVRWGGREEVLRSGLGAPIAAYEKPAAPGRPVGIFCRKARKSGFVAHKVPRETLPFDPMLMD